jgi:hypothetical protein
MLARLSKTSRSGSSVSGTRGGNDDFNGMYFYKLGLDKDLCISKKDQRREELREFMVLLIYFYELFL